MKHLTDEETFRIISFFARLYSDSLPKQGADIIYLVGQTRDNQQSVMVRGLHLFHRGISPRVGILELEPGFGYPGHVEWEKDLRGMGFSERTILIPRPEKHPNTLNETRSLVQYAKREKFETIILVMPAYHIRAFVFTLTARKEIYPELRVYVQIGEGLPWDEKVIHSQGLVRDIRIGLLLRDLTLIEEGPARGENISWEETLAYLEQRGA